MATLTINFPQPLPAPLSYRVQYRVKGSSDAYTIVEPDPVAPPIVITGLLPLTEYEGTIESTCGNGVFSTVTGFSTCNCPPEYTKSDDGNRCQKIDTQPPTVLYSNYCLAPSAHPVYSTFFTRVYNPGFNPNTVGQYTIPVSEIAAILNTPTVWRNTASSSADGPMNYDGVWVDSDCDGYKDPLLTGAQTTIAFAFENAGEERTVYVGIGGDNYFTLKVNGTVIAKTTYVDSESFRIWHVFPVLLKHGWNDFNAVVEGDGSVNDCVAMAVYNNTLAELQAATSRSNLTFLFNSASLVGQHIDVATCPDGYSLDTTGGAGNYTCRQVSTIDCGGAAA